MSREMESNGLRFEVQWKKRSGVVSRREDVTSIGLWDPEDSSLDWKTFKTYLSQNLGTLEDISVAYMDSEGDELPIESECEFQEALKFAKERARKGRETVLKVDRQGSTSASPTAPKSSESVLPKPLVLRCDKVKQSKPSNKSMHKVSSSTDVQIGPEDKKLKLKKHNSCSDHQMTEPEKIHIEKQMDLISKLMEDLKTQTGNLLSLSPCSSTEDTAPQWFKKYMQKLKSEVVSEVTAHVLHGIQQMFERQAGCCSSVVGTSAVRSSTKSKKKKKVSEEDSSDGSDSRDHKLLKKIEKLHKREKKLEKKLDSKLEKLENKTKRMMEKKSQSKARCERAPEKKVSVASRKRSSDVLTGTYLMDAVLLNDSPKTEIHIQPGKRFTKIWEIMNTGTLPWTDKTELRQAWGTMGLDPEETVVKCPILEPGEKGLITVNFRAPEYPGTFESYWHFYHMGDRFGHWIGCAVVVDSKEEWLEKGDDDEKKATVDESKSRPEHPVDLTVKTKADQELLNTAEQDINISKAKDPEYESDSDSDNLSVISGPVSLYSDSEEDENFVVVQMPACFLCDVPLGTVDKVPVVVKDCKKKCVLQPQEGMQISNDKLQNMRDINPKHLQCSLAVETEDVPERESHLIENIQQEANCAEAVTESDEMFITFSDCKPESSETTQEANSQDTTGHCRLEPQIVQFHNFVDTIYAVDMAGHCMPVESMHFGESSPTVETQNSQSGSSTSTVYSSSTSTSGGSSQPPTENSSDSHKPPPTQHSTGTAQQTSPPTHDPLGNVIHILPETLVSGAVNVATSALSTARAVISNLRSRQPGDFGDWNWNSSGGSDFSTPTDRSTTESLKLLIEMGFTNKILNVLLLQRYDNDVAKVVAELLTYEEHGANGY